MSNEETPAEVPALDYECGLGDIGCHVDHLAEWVLNVVLYVPRKLWDWLLQGLVKVLDEIEPPEWMSNATDFLAAIDGNIWYFAQVAEIPTGLAIVFSAYGIRFLIRRIPIIG